MEAVIEPQWLTYGKRLQAIASTGIHFSSDQFDRERYLEVAAVANEMLAALASVPVERIEGLSLDFGRGYATPKVDVRGALVEDDEILLVREESDGLWALPGGFAEVGLSPARNVEKEFYEEAGLIVSARRIYGVRHKASSNYLPDIGEFYKIFFLCDRDVRSVARAGLDTTEVNFFPRDNLPPLSKGRTIERDIDAAFAFALDAARPAVFD